MYVQGVSTRRVTEITRELCGLDVTSTDVSRAAAELDAQLTAWRERPLGRCAYLVLDARYETVRHAGSVISCAVLVAMGVPEEDGKRMLLGVSVSLSEAEVHWREFLEGPRKRGLEVTKLLTSDDHAGLRAARRAVFPNLLWQRCQFHPQQNAERTAGAYARRMRSNGSTANCTGERALRRCSRTKPPSSDSSRRWPPRSARSGRPDAST
jgi:transposase-like protein